MKSPILAVVGLLLSASLSLANVTLVRAPSSASQGEDVQVSYRQTTQGSLFLLWVRDRRIVKFERAPERTPGSRTLTLEAPGQLGTFQLYAFLQTQRGPRISAPISVTVGAQPVQPIQQPQRFEVTIVNRGGAGPLAPGAFALHQGSNPLFRSGTSASAGLEALAEDGDPSGLEREALTNQRVLMAGVFDTPTGQAQPGPAMPGSSYTFTFEADPGSSPRLSLATMLAQTNDAFVAPERSIALFDAQGQALPARTFGVTAWDAGTEANQAFGQGPDQAPRQAGPNTGAREGTLRLWSDSTRAIPPADQLAEINVRQRGAELEVTLRNVSGGKALVSPLTPVLHVAHGSSYELFREGQVAPAGLEALAEDGDASQLVALARNTAGVRQAAAAGSGPIAPGRSVTFRVRQGATRLTIATMIARTNDAFLAAKGVQLVANGRQRSAAAIQADLSAALAVYDAGTEANQAPGVGGNIAPLQGAPNTGPADPNSSVRRYADSTNDFSGPNAGGYARLAVRHLGSGRFEITLTNTSAGSAFPGRLTNPVVFAHAQGGSPFVVGQRGSAGLVYLAEDGGTTDFRRELGRDSRVGAVTTGFSAVVQLDRRHRFVNLATMIVPSNDAVLGLGAGLELIDSRGRVRSAQAIAADARDLLRVYDAGGERNESGGAGAGQPPATHDAGPDEGQGRVRRYDDRTWTLPALDGLEVRVRPLP